jgi:hypothetical protein
LIASLEDSDERHGSPASTPHYSALPEEAPMTRIGRRTAICMALIVAFVVVRWIVGY